MNLGQKCHIIETDPRISVTHESPKYYAVCRFPILKKKNLFLKQKSLNKIVIGQDLSGGYFMEIPKE